MGAYIEGRVEEIKEERPRLYRGWRGSKKWAEGPRKQDMHTPRHTPPSPDTAEVEAGSACWNFFCWLACWKLCGYNQSNHVLVINVARLMVPYTLTPFLLLFQLSLLLSSRLASHLICSWGTANAGSFCLYLPNAGNPGLRGTCLAPTGVFVVNMIPGPSSLSHLETK